MWPEGPFPAGRARGRIPPPRRWGAPHDCEGPGAAAGPPRRARPRVLPVSPRRRGGRGRAGGRRVFLDTPPIRATLVVFMGRLSEEGDAGGCGAGAPGCTALHGVARGMGGRPSVVHGRAGRAHARRTRV